MSTAFAAAVRERAQMAWQALQAARQERDAHAVLVAEAEWEDVRRLADAHAVSIEATIEAAAAEAGGAGPAGKDAA
ncbi:hypothetical protein ACIBO5_51355 [Nonomuraea angiospora]|uniref:hypothetical protein n=1 Tax=Nonomuraea angiospora TaxID=46172 RepID=UPI0029B11E03|nr:hypothetical protein [Nonomuraea angiospora]MDX3103456.1 hypothetical protein [Nonomuraea angiospora]